jgi:hypothetical protein
MVRAAMQHEENRVGWPLIFAFNRLRNEIAHARKSEKQAALINDLRTRLNGCVAEGEENPAARDIERKSSWPRLRYAASSSSAASKR